MNSNCDKQYNECCLWKPNNRQVLAVDKFQKYLHEKYISISENASYHELQEWSCKNYDKLWEAVWDFCGVISSSRYTQVIDMNKGIADIPQWFSGSRLNYAENLLQFNDDRIALYATGECQRGISKRTYRELNESVKTYASAMIKLGIRRGDRVAGYMPNCCETVELMLAAASIGAIWSSASPDFGPHGVLERFSQIHPKLLFSVNAVYYNGKVHSHINKIDHIVKHLPDLVKVVVFHFVPDEIMDLSSITNSCTLEEFISLSDPTSELHFEQMEFTDPLFIMYSSGTTGCPKCLVHSIGGTLLKHLEEHAIQSGMTRDDIMLFYTTTGWMMWNWMVGCLALGCGIVLYDGSPFMPNETRLWDLIDQLGITIFGAGAKCISFYEDKDLKLMDSHNLTSLRMIMSTGSPLKSSTFDYLYSKVKKDLIVASISGGTDIIACFMGQNESLPVYRGQIQGLLLGCAVETWNDAGEKVVDSSGELVVTKPFPSMPVFFWNDPDGSKYKNAYFNKFPGVWAHGDFCRIDSKTGGITMLGRSDNTLNPNGVRFGTAEIYNIVETFKEISDSVCVSQKKQNGLEERVVLFLKMSQDCELTPEFEENLKLTIRESLSARHVPKVVLPVTDILYTMNGKKVEKAVKQILDGEKLTNSASLLNPEASDIFVACAKQLKDY